MIPEAGAFVPAHLTSCGQCEAFSEDAIEVSPEEVGAKVCARVDCEFAWFVVPGFEECPACELRSLRLL